METSGHRSGGRHENKLGWKRCKPDLKRALVADYLYQENCHWMFMSTIRSQKIPAQRHGEEADIIETVKAATEEDAKQVFREARQKLFDVSHWENISKGISASFVLTDQSGRPKEGIPAPGDHFRINIPGPGSAAGSGYDWVKVELVEDSGDVAASSESPLLK